MLELSAKLFVFLYPYIVLGISLRLVASFFFKLDGCNEKLIAQVQNPPAQMWEKLVQNKYNGSATFMVDLVIIRSSALYDAGIMVLMDGTWRCRDFQIFLRIDLQTQMKNVRIFTVTLAALRCTTILIVFSSPMLRFSEESPLPPTNILLLSQWLN